MLLRFYKRYLENRFGVERVAELQEYESGGLPDLVAEEAIALHPQYVQVDVAPRRTGVGEQGETQSVRAALRYALTIII